jgi:HAD superfamily hydrolase (TIGR01509 family)
MKEQYKFIFDLDGTLYRFDKGQGQIFATSQFYADLRSNAYAFFMKRCGLSKDAAIVEYEMIKEKYNGEVSLGVEQEYEIDRYDYFANTWNLNPEEYIEKDNDLPQMFDQLKGRIALLTAAPRIWAINVLAYLDIVDIFEGRFYTGEPDERKPNPRIFQRIADDFGIFPSKVFSIGDQEYSDIAPAKSIGMGTVLIGSAQNSIADYQAGDVKLAINLLRKEGFV